MNYPTPHIKATPIDFAKTVLMPGDPRRSEFIAKNFLEGARLVNDVRGVKGYTGIYHGTRVSVMASGMGMPSMGIYSYELFTTFGVENILRVGSAGALAGHLNLRDLVFGMGACTNSAYASQYNLGGTFAPIASYELLAAAVREAEAAGARYSVGNLLSSDVFYNSNEHFNDPWRDMGCLAVEMEAAALYMNAAKTGKRALAICAISDHIYRAQALDSDARETSFTDMITVALNTAHALDS